jgi:hypothetical protein
MFTPSPGEYPNRALVSMDVTARGRATNALLSRIKDDLHLDPPAVAINETNEAKSL